MPIPESFKDSKLEISSDLNTSGVPNKFKNRGRTGGLNTSFKKSRNQPGKRRTKSPYSKPNNMSRSPQRAQTRLPNSKRPGIYKGGKFQPLSSELTSKLSKLNRKGPTGGQVQNQNHHSGQIDNTNNRGGTKGRNG